MVLRGARIAFATEPDKSARLRGGTLKRLVSIDQMTGRGLYGAPSAWDPTHSLHLGVEPLTGSRCTPPMVSGAGSHWCRGTSGSRSQARTRIPEDPDLAETLAGEAPGILAWAVRGAVAFAGGRSLWPFPAAVQVKTAAYRAEERQARRVLRVPRDL